MESPKEPLETVLYDFLYKDKDRLESYYSQLFKGYLQSQLLMSSASDSKESAGKGVLGFSKANLTGDIKMGNYSTDSTSLTITPHDYSVTITIDHLLSNNFINNSLVNAKNNSLVLLDGSINILEKSYSNMLIDLVEEDANKNKNKNRNGEDYKNILKGIKMFRNFDYDATFYFKDNEQVAAGFIKEDFLIDKLSTISLLYGGGDILGVKMIGIKHSISDWLTAINLQQNMLKKLSHTSMRQIFFDKIEYFITPIVIFRELMCISQ